MADGESGQDKNRELVAEIYESILRPDRYDRFMELWGEYIDRAVVEQKPEAGAKQIPASVPLDPTVSDHFSRAFELFEKMGRSERQRSSDPFQIVETHHAPAQLFSTTGELLAQSEAAELLYGKIARASQMQPLLNPDSYRRLTAALERLRYSFSPQSSGVLALSQHDEANARRSGGFLLMRPARSANGARLLMLVAPTIRWSERLNQLLADGFGVTSGEAMIVRDVTNGLSVEEIAEERGRSVHTVRTQLKSVFRKTGVQNQAELVRLAMSLALEDDLSMTDTGFNPVLIDEGTLKSVTLQDGRRMDYHILGPENGRPVVFVHGMLDGVAITSVISRSLHKRGICLIAPVRPAFGNSSPLNVAPTNAPDAFARDLDVLLQSCGVSQPVVIAGHMAGSVYAFAAAAGPAKIKSVLAISGGVPIVSLSQFSEMNLRQRVVAYTARFAPRLLPTVLRAGIAQIDSGTIDEFMTALYPPESEDYQLLRETAIRNAIQTGYRFAVAQGHLGFEVDSWHVTRDWSNLVRAANIRSVHMHGTNDPVVKIDSVRAFVERHNSAELVEMPEAGQLLFYADPEAVLDRLETMMAG
ncbi:MAG: alpha/beta fold hydrolase [Nitratireductor sp.]